MIWRLAPGLCSVAVEHIMAQTSAPMPPAFGSSSVEDARVALVMEAYLRDNLLQD